MISYNQGYNTQPIYEIQHIEAIYKVQQQNLRLGPHTGASAASGEGHTVPKRV